MQRCYGHKYNTKINLKVAKGKTSYARSRRNDIVLYKKCFQYYFLYVLLL